MHDVLSFSALSNACVDTCSYYTQSVCDNWHLDKPIALPRNDLTRYGEEGWHRTETLQALASVTLVLSHF